MRIRTISRDTRICHLPNLGIPHRNQVEPVVRLGSSMWLPQTFGACRMLDVHQYLDERAGSMTDLWCFRPCMNSTSLPVGEVL